jgi:plasmid stabilization system protein ParE
VNSPIKALASLAFGLLGCPHQAAPTTSPTGHAHAVASASASPVATVPIALGCSDGASVADATWLTGLPHLADGAWGVVGKPETSDKCATAESNLRAAARAILEAPESGAPAPHDAWDGKTTPAELDRVVTSLGLAASEKRAIVERSFASLESRPYESYTEAFHEIFQRQLPIYVSIDAVLHAVYESNDDFMADLEEHKLLPALEHALASMHGALRAAAPSYPHEAASDLDLYLTVARSLLADALVSPVLGPQPEVGQLVASAKRAEGRPTVHLFGRDRVIDFSQYQPRGHYDRRASLRRFFRASMWCSRLELNLVSRSSRSSQPGVAPDPNETPREDLDALALADLAARSKADVKIAELDHAWALLAGPREDVSIADLEKLGVGISAPDAAERLRRAIGAGFKRTVRFHYMPEGSSELPAITTLLGPRIVPDSRAVMHLVHSEVDGRHHVTADDFAFALGHDRAKKYLANELGQFPTLGAHLDAARGEMTKPLACGDLYSAWFGAIRSLADKPKGGDVMPSVMHTEAFADLRIDSAIAAYGQLRHNYVLVAAQTYDEAGCDIPDGWVDPAVSTYDALLTYAARGVEVSKELGQASDVKYFERLGTILAVLRRIAKDEVAGRPLSDDEKRFLSMVVEMIPGSTGSGPTYTGWYLEMFRTLEDALGTAAFVTDVFTSSDSGEVDYIGARGPVLGVFVIDSSAPPRAFVGPVARAYEHTGNVANGRLTDAAATKLTAFAAPWSASYTVAGPPEVPLSASMTLETGAWRLKMNDAHHVIIEALDHHGVVVGSAEVDGGPKQRSGVIRVHGNTIRRMRVRVGDYTVFSDSPGVMDDTVTIERLNRAP